MLKRILSTPVREDVSLSQQLAKIIKQLSQDESLRLASERQKSQRMDRLSGAIGDTEVAGVRLERILAGNELTDISYLTLGAMRAKSVGRIVIRDGNRITGFGTGFLVAPGVLMTNHHVLENESKVRDSLVQFRYERNVKGMDLLPVQFAFQTNPAPIIYQGLDIAIVQVQPQSEDGQALSDFGWLPLNPDPGKAFVGEFLTIIQHPKGERKQVCVRENRLLKFEENTPFLWYQTDTVGGSSGSPVFNNSWDVVALHHSSVPRVNAAGDWLTQDGKKWTPDMGDDAIDWIANEGVRISRILDYLSQNFASHPLSIAMRSVTDPAVTESVGLEGDSSTMQNGMRMTRDSRGNLKVYLPIEIDVATGISGFARPTSPPPQSASPNIRQTSVPAPSSSADEKVEIDQTNYSERNGYDPNFLGDGIQVPLPKVASTRHGKPLQLARNQAELKYYNYSVVMNADRGLAFFSAANVRPKNEETKRDGDAFIRDSRVDKIDRTAQIGKEFYGKQSTFEAEDRSKNPFDQGHLTRREDLQWGKTPAIAKRNGDDSFHYTNCAPQHFAFNQNRKVSGIWNRLETAAVGQLSVGTNLCIINGPIFDAPKCVPGAGGVLKLNIKGRSSPDPVFGGVKIPKQFFKLVAFNDGGQLRAKAFVVTQEDLLVTIGDRLKAQEAASLTDAEIRLYQVTIPQLELLTGLKFGLPKMPPDSQEAFDVGQPIDPDAPDLFQ